MEATFSGLQKKAKTAILLAYLQRVLKAISGIWWTYGFRVGSHYTGCHDFPLYNFIKISVTGDLNWIKKRGYVPKPILKKVFENIIDDYGRISENPKYRQTLRIGKEIRFLEGKLTIIQLIINQLATRYDKRLCDYLIQQGFRFNYSPDDQERYFKELKLTVSQAKAMFLRRDDLKQELKQITETSGQPVSESDYDDILSELSRYQMQPLYSKEITVSYFLAILKRFNREREVAAKGYRKK